MLAVKIQTNNDYLTEPKIQKNGLINHIKCRLNEEFGVSLKEGFFNKNDSKLYIYEDKIQEYIEEFPCFNITARTIRNEIKDLIDEL
jgi:hypothetical protein